MVIRDQDVRLDGLHHLLDKAVHVLMVLAGKDVQPQQLPLLSSTTTSISTLSPLTFTNVPSAPITARFPPRFYLACCWRRAISPAACTLLYTVVFPIRPPKHSRNPQPPHGFQPQHTYNNTVIARSRWLCWAPLLTPRGYTRKLRRI